MPERIREARGLQFDEDMLDFIITEGIGAVLDFEPELDSGIRPIACPPFIVKLFGSFSIFFIYDFSVRFSNNLPGFESEQMLDCFVDKF